MKVSTTATAAAAAVLALLLTVPAVAQETAAPHIPPKAPPREMPDSVRASWACVAGGSAGVAAAVAAGAENLINVIAGGIVVPANRSVMVIGLAGVVFSTFCTMGQQLLPLVDYYNPWGAGDDSREAGYPPLQNESAKAAPPAVPVPELTVSALPKAGS
jgi:hypothetical protein